MHPALWPVHSCRTLEFCPRIARLSTELRCPPVYILATNRGCIQCNFLHCQSRQIPFWACHSACWKRGSQGPGTAKMQQTGSPWRKLSTVGLPEKSVQAGPGRPWPRPSAPTAPRRADARCCIRSACDMWRFAHLPPTSMSISVAGAVLYSWKSRSARWTCATSLLLWSIYNAAASPFTDSSRT